MDTLIERITPIEKQVLDDLRLLIKNQEGELVVKVNKGEVTDIWPTLKRQRAVVYKLQHETIRVLR